MIGKKTLESKPIPAAKVKEILEEFSEKHELSYEQNLTLDHATNLNKLSLEDTEKLIEELEAYVDYKQAVRSCSYSRHCTKRYGRFKINFRKRKKCSFKRWNEGNSWNLRKIWYRRRFILINLFIPYFSILILQWLIITFFKQFLLLLKFFYFYKNCNFFYLCLENNYIFNFFYFLSNQ